MDDTVAGLKMREPIEFERVTLRRANHGRLKVWMRCSQLEANIIPDITGCIPRKAGEAARRNRRFLLCAVPVRRISTRFSTTSGSDLTPLSTSLTNRV